MRHAFVILHYMCPDMTVKAVGSVLGLDGAQDAEVVVVDNCSPDGSGATLAEKYASEPRVTVLRLDSNLGFAGGNNAGYTFLRERGEADFIVVMNNDVLIEQREFLHKIEDLYSEKKFAVLGPDIFGVKTGVHQNPAHARLFSIEEVRTLRERLERRDKHYFRNYWAFRLKCLLGFARKSRPADPDLWKRGCSGAVLHGACYVFSAKFIVARPFAFNPGTFLYMEEDILAKECSDAGLEMQYSPELKVIHLEDKSTSAVWRTEYRRSFMKNRQMLRSCRILERLYGE